MTDIQALLDRQAITDLIYAYCRAVDRLDVPLGRSIWNAGSHADYGADVYQGDGPGVIDLICRQHARTLHHSHQVTNILIALDGDTAGSESYCFATLRVGQAGAIRQMTVWTRYIDRWSRRDGRWGLDRRQAIRDFDQVGVGRRDRSDPSYAVLEPAR